MRTYNLRDGPGASPPSAGRWRAGLLIVLALAGAWAPASDRVLIPSAAELWRARLKQALVHIRAGEDLAGLEILQEAVMDRGGDVYEVRDEKLLTSPLDVEIEDAVLVTEKTESPPERLPRVGLVPARRPVFPPSADDAVGNRPRRFLPISSVARIILRRLPDSVRKQYRERHDERAKSLLESYERTGSESFLVSLVDDYFFSSYGTRAAETLADIYWESGRWLSALRLWRTILLDPPSASVKDVRMRSLAKLIRGLRGLGRDVEAEELAAEVLRSLETDGDNQGREDGEAARIKALAASEGATPRQERVGPAFPSGRVPSRWGGELTMTALPEVSDRPLEFSWDSWVWMPKLVNLVGTPFTLLIDDDSVFVPAPDGVYRLDARPGRGSILQHYIHPGLELRYPEDNETLQYSVTLWKKRFEPYELLADLPSEIVVSSYIADLVNFDHYLGYEINAEVPVRGLIAYDGATSQPLWKISEDPLRDRASQPPPRARAPRGRITKEAGRSAGEKGLSYNSPAVVRQGLVIVGGWVQRGYINNVLRAHDLRDGSLVWETMVSSAQLEQTMFGELAREPFPGAICEEGGIVYYCTQQGTVTAVELATGKLSWLMTYETIPIEVTFGRQARKRLVSWGANSMLLKDNILIVTPRDSQYLYAIDTGSGPGGEANAGRILWKYRNSRGELRDLLGYLDGYLYFSGHGSGAVLRLDIRELDTLGHLKAPPLRRGLAAPDTPSSRAGASSRAPASETRPSPRLERAALQLGIGSSIPPGALTPRGVVIADGGRLRLVSPDLQSITDLSAPFRDLPGRDVPGRVQVSRGMVFVTSKNLVSAYAAESVE